MRITALLSCAVVFGLTLGHVLQAPGSRGLDGATWLEVQHTFYGGFAAVGGLAEVVGVIAAVTVAIVWRRQTRTAVVHTVAALCLVATLLAYWFGNRPVNEKVAQWTSATLPADWLAYRNAWESAHAISCGLAAIATVILLIAAIRCWSVKDCAAIVARETDA